MVIAEGEFEPWSTAEAADEVLVVPDHFGEPEAEDAGLSSAAASCCCSSGTSKSPLRGSLVIS